MATVIVLGLPVGSIFGMDLHAWQVGPRFQGIGQIPPGLHILSFGPQNAPTRSSLLTLLDSGQLLILEWCSESEGLLLSSHPVNPQDISIAPYPSDDDLGWREIVSHIRQDHVSRIFPEAIAPNLYCLDQHMSSYHDEADKELTALLFTEINLKRPPAGVNPTAFAMDKSSLLEGLVLPDLLAEFSLSFLIVLLGLNFSGLQQWRTIFSLISQSQSVPDAFLQDFIHHLRLYISIADETGNDLFEEVFKSVDVLFLVREMADLVQRAALGSARLRSEAANLTAYVKAKYGWDLMDEPLETDEDLPQVVTL